MNGESNDPPTPSDASPDPAFKVVVIGSSAGGIPALKLLLSALPPDFGAAIVVVQHRKPSGPGMLARVLGRSCPLRVRDAVDGERLRPGVVLLAPSDRHLTVGPGDILSLDQSERIHAVRPSAEKLFVSAAENLGSRVIALVLTGAARDGELGVRAVKRMGGMVIAQDEETSAVFGMPRAAIDSGAVDLVLPLPSIAPALVELAVNSG